MDNKCRNCQPYPIDVFAPMIRVSYGYGVKKLEEPRWKLKRIPGKRTLFNWFPEDEGILEGEFAILSGVNYDDMLRYALGAGMKVQIAEE